MNIYELVGVGGADGPIEVIYFLEFRVLEHPHSGELFLEAVVIPRLGLLENALVVREGEEVCYFGGEGIEFQ